MVRDQASGPLDLRPGGEGEGSEEPRLQVGILLKKKAIRLFHVTGGIIPARFGNPEARSQNSGGKTE